MILRCKGLELPTGTIRIPPPLPDKKRKEKEKKKKKKLTCTGCRREVDK